MRVWNRLPDGSGAMHTSWWESERRWITTMGDDGMQFMRIKHDSWIEAMWQHYGHLIILQLQKWLRLKNGNL